MYKLILEETLFKKNKSCDDSQTWRPTKHTTKLITPKPIPFLILCPPTRTHFKWISLITTQFPSADRRATIRSDARVSGGWAPMEPPAQLCWQRLEVVSVVRWSARMAPPTETTGLAVLVWCSAIRTTSSTTPATISNSICTTSTTRITTSSCSSSSCPTCTHCSSTARHRPAHRSTCWEPTAPPAPASPRAPPATGPTRTTSVLWQVRNGFVFRFDFDLICICLSLSYVKRGT